MEIIPRGESNPPVSDEGILYSIMKLNHLKFSNIPGCTEPSVGAKEKEPRNKRSNLP